VPPEWHSWISHIRMEPPTNDPVMQNLSPPWKAVRINYLSCQLHRLVTWTCFAPALGRKFDGYKRRIQTI
jgi:NADH:ubiquinone oxidoreductase subunit